MSSLKCQRINVYFYIHRYFSIPSLHQVRDCNDKLKKKVAINFGQLQCDIQTGDLPILIHSHFISSVDANTEPQTGPKFGRLVNHGIGGEINSKIVVKTYNNRPVLCLFATKDIKQDTEILYDYGIINLPWVKEVSVQFKFTPPNSLPPLPREELTFRNFQHSNVSASITIKIIISLVRLFVGKNIAELPYQIVPFFLENMEFKHHQAPP